MVAARRSLEAVEMTASMEEMVGVKAVWISHTLGGGLGIWGGMGSGGRTRWRDWLVSEGY